MLAGTVGPAEMVTSWVVVTVAVRKTTGHVCELAVDWRSASRGRRRTRERAILGNESASTCIWLELRHAYGDVGGSRCGPGNDVDKEC